MKPVVKRWLGWAGYPLLYLMLLALFARCTFPYERVRDRLVAEFNTKQASAGMRIEIAEMSGYWLSGIEAEGVKVTRTPGVVAPGAIPEPAASLEDLKPHVTLIDHVYGSVSMLRLLFGTTAGSFGMKMQSGEVEGHFSSSNDAQSLDLSLSKVNVGDLPMLSDMAGLPLKGTVDGSLEVELPEKKASKAEGKIELNMSGISAGDGKAKVLKVIALPELKVGNVKLGATITDGKLKVDTMTAKGSDFEMLLDGNIRLREPVPLSILDLALEFRFLDSYKNKNDITRGLFGAPGGVPGLFEMDEKVRRSKREDGFYGWRVIGSMDKPLFEPSPTGVGTRGAARTPAKRNTSKPSVNAATP
ncbi:MAG TPA: type II secretion system protein GspN [Polyangiaceae bacterium]